MEKTNNFLIGCHVSNVAKHPYNKLNYLEGALMQAINHKANCFMIFLGAPQNSIRTNIDKYDPDNFFKLIYKHKFKIENIIVHAPYIVNLASPNEYKRKKSVNFIIEEFQRMAKFNLKTIVIHPGNYMNSNKEQGLLQCVKSINSIYKHCYQYNIKMALETMSGKGTEICSSFDEIKFIINKVNAKYQKLIGTCLDTCHLFNAGYDIADISNIIDQIKLNNLQNKIFAIHVNDSLTKLGENKDFHANIGKGYIGINAIKNFIKHKLFFNCIKVLETPWVNKKPIYTEEIELLKK